MEVKQIKELRIDNYVSIIPHGKEDILKLDISNLESLLMFKNFDRIKGIPITKWWLERLGAEQVNSKSGLMASYKLAGIKFDVSNSGNVYHSQTKKPIHFVHRLQNLVFELKDIELTINE